MATTQRMAVTTAWTWNIEGTERVGQQGLFVGGSVGLAINVISYGQNAMARIRARIVLVSGLGDVVYVERTNIFQEFDLACEYIRERKKRGKASRKDLAQQQAAAAASGRPISPTGYSSDGPSPTRSNQNPDYQGETQSSKPELPPPPVSAARSASMSSGPLRSTGMMGGVSNLARANSIGTAQDVEQNVPTDQHLHKMTKRPFPSDHRQSQPPRGDLGHSPTPISLNGFGLMHDYDRPGMHGMTPLGGAHMMHNGAPSNQMPPNMASQSGYHSYGDAPYSMMSPQEHPGPPGTFRFGGTGESPLTGFMGTSPAVGSPGWLSLPSPSGGTYQPQNLLHPTNTLRYPVLQPLLPHISSVLPVSLACDLVDFYFTSSSSAHMHPRSPYVTGYVFRKRSFLHPTKPRTRSPALLASMLWLAAQTSDAPFLTSTPSARGRVCQKLLELTVGFLKPLIHGPSSGEISPNYGVNTVINGVALGGLGVAMSGGEPLNAEGGSPRAIDDVATYIHLATVVSASEYKAASLRWWNAAWSLARELKLGRELPPDSPHAQNADHPHGDDADADGEVDLDVTPSAFPNGNNPAANPPCSVTEEEREERRRIWWLLYIQDRHLALCYNKPLCLMDAECDGLLQPMDDTVWQAGEFDSSESNTSTNPSSPRYRHRGPNFECTGHSIFGYFLPLMAILGEIVDLNHARQHPRVGLGFRSADEWDKQAAEIRQQLENYGRSLKDFEARFTTNPGGGINDSNDAESNNPDAAIPSVKSAHSHASSARIMSETVIQTKIVAAYGTHVMHVLHILLTGKWDPISLLDDNDLWISSQSFISATGHAVSAAEAINDILEYDPDLSFMPYFFGIYLLQGSFLLLLIADKLQGEASPAVVKACESIVRAHEACVVTLNTEYQVFHSRLERSLANAATDICCP